MKNFGLTLVMFLFVGLTATMAQDKKEATASESKTEMKADHACKPGCSMACCAGKASGEKKSCTPEEKAKCAHSSDAKKEEHEGSGSPE